MRSPITREALSAWSGYAGLLSIAVFVAIVASGLRLSALHVVLLAVSVVGATLWAIYREPKSTHFGLPQRLLDAVAEAGLSISELVNLPVGSLAAGQGGWFSRPWLESCGGDVFVTDPRLPLNTSFSNVGLFALCDTTGTRTWVFDLGQPGFQLVPTDHQLPVTYRLARRADLVPVRVQ